jgi:hypothetical protein
MALSANIIWEVRPSGSDNSGGGFVSGASGTDYSQQNAAQFSGTDLVIDATTNTKVTSVTHNFVAADVGNIIQITAGTGFTTGFYQIVSVASNAATLDRSPGVVGLTMGTWAEGGALASIGKVGSVITAHTCYIYNAGSSVYSITSASTNVAAGCVNVTGNFSYFIGYSTNRNINTTDTGPTIQLNVATATIFAGSACVINLTLDGNSQTTSKASTAGGSGIYRCTIKNFTGAGACATPAYYCTATANSGTVFTNSSSYCEAYANTATPYNTTGRCFRNLSYSNTGATTDGFLMGAFSAIDSCVAYANGRHGFNQNSTNAIFINNISEGHTAGWGFNNLASGMLFNNAHFNNNSGGIAVAAGTNNSFQTGSIALTASPFVNAASSNFALNTTAGGGKLVRGLGYGIFLRALTVGYPDAGAAQHPDATVAYTFA